MEKTFINHKKEKKKEDVHLPKIEPAKASFMSPKVIKNKNLKKKYNKRNSVRIFAGIGLKKELERSNPIEETINSEYDHFVM